MPVATSRWNRPFVLRRYSSADLSAMFSIRVGNLLSQTVDFLRRVNVAPIAS